MSVTAVHRRRYLVPPTSRPYAGGVGELVPPFFAIEGHDVQAFDSLERMARAVEVYDPRYLLYVDAHGTRLTATTERYTVTGFVVTPDAANESTTLESALRYHLRHAGTGSTAPASEGVPQLIDRFIALRDRPRPSRWRRLFRPGS